MGGVYFSQGASTLVELARKIEKTLDDSEKHNMSLDSNIDITDRQHLGWTVEEMEKKPKEKQSIFLKNMKELLQDPTNEWFAFFHVHS